MPQMIKFPSINQFRNVIKAVQHKARFAGLDDNGDPVYKDAELPVLTFTGTIKIHGTNAAVVQEADGNIYFQSRNNVITPENDNAGFATFMAQEVGVSQLSAMFEPIRLMYGLDDTTIAIYGEWCGGSIQKGVAVSSLEKMFVIFGVKLIDGNETEWLDLSTLRQWRLPERIYASNQFGVFELDIDFNNPQLAQNTLIDITTGVENCCPVGKFFGVEGTGEGVVWMCNDPDYRDFDLAFKVKGEKHSASKVKKLAAVDVEKLNSINEFVDSVVTEGRLDQAIEYLNEQKIELSQRATGDFIRWIHGDIIKEESDTMEANGIVQKDIGAPVSKKARLWFFNYLDENMRRD